MSLAWRLCSLLCLVYGKEELGRPCMKLPWCVLYSQINFVAVRCNNIQSIVLLAVYRDAETDVQHHALNG